MFYTQLKNVAASTGISQNYINLVSLNDNNKLIIHVCQKMFFIKIMRLFGDIQLRYCNLSIST